MKRLPDFIGIGVVKCATSWTFKQITSHPDICGSVKKELHFFDWRRCDLAKYKKTFGKCQTKLCGEWTPEYFTYPDVPRKISKLVPNVKLIVALRHPVERAWSNFKSAKGIGKIPPNASFSDAFFGDMPHSNRSDYSTLKYRGFYANNLKRWFKYFDKNQFFYSFFDNVLIDPVKQIGQIYEWLGVDSKYVSPTIQAHRKKETPYSNLTLPIVSYNKILKYYLPHIEKLETLIGVDLTHWKQFK